MDAQSCNLVLFSTAIGFSIAASYFDIKTGEIPDKFTVGLVVVALALRAAFSLELSDFNYLLDGLIVGGIFFGFGAALFYTGGWGGGDAKLIAGIGASIGGFMGPSIVDSSFLYFPAFFGFFVALSIVAIPYSLLYAIVLSLRSPKVFSLTKQKLAASWLLLALAVAGSTTLFILIKPWSVLMVFAIVSPPLFYLLILFTRSVEEVAMQKEIALKDLREGDMLAEDLVINGKKLASKRDMDGVSKEALKKIKSAKGAPKKVRIKWGIRFAPAFPLALLVSPIWGGLVAALI
jgi:Flp pilus assembly protein protease CpaA